MNIPAKYRKAVYVVCIVLACGAFAAGVVTPEEVNQGVDAASQILALVASIWPCSTSHRIPRAAGSKRPPGVSSITYRPLIAPYRPFIRLVRGFLFFRRKRLTAIWKMISLQNIGTERGAS
jgi:hypothetical protein